MTHLSFDALPSHFQIRLTDLMGQVSDMADVGRAGPGPSNAFLLRAGTRGSGMVCTHLKDATCSLSNTDRTGEVSAGSRTTGCPVRPAVIPILGKTLPHQVLRGQQRRRRYPDPDSDPPPWDRPSGSRRSSRTLSVASPSSPGTSRPFAGCTGTRYKTRPTAQ